jgi:hypothetical protein
MLGFGVEVQTQQITPSLELMISDHLKQFFENSDTKFMFHFSSLSKINNNWRLLQNNLSVHI